MKYTPARWFTLDPRIKLLALLVVNVIAFGRGGFILPIVAFGCVGVFLATTLSFQRWLMVMAAIPLFALFGLYVPGLLPYPLVLVLGIAAYWVSRFGVSIALAYYVIKTTRVSEFVAALRSWHIPQVILVPLTVMLRFIPIVLQELRAIVDAMRLRGVAGSGWSMAAHPIRTAEYVVVPLLATTTRLSDDLAASGMLRGLARPGQRTCVTPIGMHLADGVVLIIMVTLFGLHITNIDLLI